jgi:flagellar biosynthesis protein FliQ
MTEQEQIVMGDQAFSRYFGAAIAVILLGLYTFTAVSMVVAVWDCEHANIAAPPGEADANAEVSACVDSRVTSGATYVVTTVGGLVSALVVAVLGATTPGVNPSRALVSENATARVKTLGSVVVVLYLIVWAGAGLAALIVGLMVYPDASQTLANLGTTWLGIAVAAGYAYFGIKPQ